MRNFIFTLLTILTITSCKKEEIVPQSDPCHSGIITNMYITTQAWYNDEGTYTEDVVYVFVLQNNCSAQTIEANVSRKDYYDYDINDEYKMVFSW
jgi:hypothetical protein